MADKCLTVKLNNAINGDTSLNPTVGDLVIVSEATESGGGRILGSLNSNYSIDGIENPTSTQIDAFDWNQKHVIRFHNKYQQGIFEITSSYDVKNPAYLYLNDFKYCNSISELKIKPRGRYHYIIGDIANFANSKNKISYFQLGLDFNIDDVYGELSDVIGRACYNIDVSKLPNITCDIAKLTDATALYRYYNLSKSSCSDSTSRSSKSYPSLAGRFIFEDDIDVDNFLISNANCRWSPNNNSTRVSSHTTIAITKEDYTPSTDAIAAIQNLKTNMFVNAGDAERTEGTYFTVKINNVEQ